MRGLLPLHEEAVPGSPAEAERHASGDAVSAAAVPRSREPRRQAYRGRVQRARQATGAPLGVGRPARGGGRPTATPHQPLCGPRASGPTSASQQRGGLQGRARPRARGTRCARRNRAAAGEARPPGPNPL